MYNNMVGKFGGRMIMNHDYIDIKGGENNLKTLISVSRDKFVIMTGVSGLQDILCIWYGSRRGIKGERWNRWVPMHASSLATVRSRMDSIEDSVHRSWRRPGINRAFHGRTNGNLWLFETGVCNGAVSPMSDTQWTHHITDNQADMVVSWMRIRHAWPSIRRAWQKGEPQRFVWDAASMKLSKPKADGENKLSGGCESFRETKSQYWCGVVDRS